VRPDAAFQRATPSSELDDQASHGDRCHRKQAHALARRGGSLVHDPEVSLVDDLGRGQGLVWPAAPQLSVGDPAQFVVHQRDEPVERFTIAPGGIDEQVGARVLNIHGEHNPAAGVSAFSRRFASTGLENSDA
jgi:hypothetical protein